MTATEQPRPVGPAPAPDRPPRRWATALAVFLLITVPAFYLVISAIQSSDSGEDKQEHAAATGLTAGLPSRVQRRIYDVPVPVRSGQVAYYETNSWKASSLYVQFTTSPPGFTAFLHSIGTDPARLAEDEVTISDKEARTAGWSFGSGQNWSGLVVQQERPQPKLKVTVSRRDPSNLKVYVVSTIHP
ncbi:hypothetical protein RKE29_16260 [Streptomyces sp. B1866]|uniref:hypothetical protein n=1 Tax=Streptomyces sp. B1866 TaxID=3075431 RepID=UPI00288F227E|nr:hypothetical protein [Streptomyces sp. B1866]MDT3398177.1 hypothetical protein [Streptomyces sp. B1866]